MDIKAIRSAIAGAVDGISVGGRTVIAKGYVFVGDPPFAYPGEVTADYRTDEATVTLRLLTSQAEDRSGQEMLDDLLASSGASSVKAAIEADATLAALVDSVAVAGFDGYQPYEVAGTDYYGAEVTVVILA